jgi:hypothetical protein
MTYDMNAVYGYTLDGDKNKFPDDQKRGFIIYGSTQDILNSMEDMYSHLQTIYPDCKVIRKEDDGTLRDMPVIDTSTLTEEQKIEMINAAQGFYIDSKFTVGPVEVKTNRQWLFEAFGMTDIPEYTEDDEYYIEDAETEMVDSQQ